MFNKNLFRSILAAAGDTMADAAKIINCHPATLTRKMVAGEFSRIEIERFRVHYNVEPATIMAIFFAE